MKHFNSQSKTRPTIGVIALIIATAIGFQATTAQAGSSSSGGKKITSFASAGGLGSTRIRGN